MFRYTLLVLVAVFCVVNAFDLPNINTITETHREQLKVAADRLNNILTALEKGESIGHIQGTPTSVKCTRTKQNQCERGTVQIDSWTTNSLAFQTHLYDNVPLDHGFRPATHNSHIDFADGYGLYQDEVTALVRILTPKERVQISNQWLTITDQLNMGLRHIELDIHYWKGKIRICHAGFHLKQLDALLQFLAKELKIEIKWDAETLGCFSLGYPTLNDALTEIVTWLKNPSRAKEVLIIYFDDQMDLQQWGLVKNITYAIHDVVGDMAISYEFLKQYFPNRWPTPNEMLSLGKRFLFTSGQDYKSDNDPYIFPIHNVWQEWPFHELKPYPICEPKLNRTLGVNLTRLHADILKYAWFYGKPDNVTAANIALGVECNYNFLSMDAVIPESIKGFVWSWKEGEPASKGCTLFEGASGRWIASNCSKVNYCAFQSVSDKMNWVKSSNQVIFTQCNSLTPSGYSFTFPHEPIQNRKLKDFALKTNLWLNYIN